MRVHIGPPKRVVYRPRKRWPSALAAAFLFITFGSTLYAHKVRAQTAEVVSSCGTPNTTYSVGQHLPTTQDTTGKGCTASSATLSGSTSNAGSGVATSATNVPTVSYNYGFNGTTWDQLQVDASKNLKMNCTVGCNSPAATHAQCGALCTSLVAKASGGTLYSFEVNADSTLSGAAWFVLVFDATSFPANGAVAPAKCYGQASGTTQMGGTFATNGVSLPTGVTIGVSTTGCFTLTSSTHAYIAADFQ